MKTELADLAAAGAITIAILRATDVRDQAGRDQHITEK